MRFRILNLKLKIQVVFIANFLLVNKVLAQSGNNFTDNLGPFKGIQLDANALIRMIGGIACRFLQFGVIAIGVMMVFFGILFLMSRGDSQKYSNAKRSLTWGIVGGLVIMGVFTIILSVPVILSALGLNAQPYDIFKVLNNCSQ